MLIFSLEKIMVSGTGSTMKILFVTENMPIPAIAGSSQRTSNILQGLSELGEVDIFLLRGEKEKGFLSNSGYSVVGSFDSSRQQSIRSNLLKVLLPLRDYSPKQEIITSIKNVFDNGGYDIIVGRYVRPSLTSGLSIIGTSIIDVDDVDLSSLESRINASQTSWLLKAILKYRLYILNKNYSNLLSPYKCLFIASEQDRNLIKHKNMHVVPNISYNSPEANTVEPSSSNIILWVGSFNHRVNLDGLDAFISNDWLKIAKLHPTAVLRVVGSHLPETKEKQWRLVKNIDVVGFVDSLEEQYKQAAFTIVPLWDGAGTKIKVLESFMFNRTAVVTSHAARGFDLFGNNQSMMIANSGEEFIQKTVELLTGVELRHKMEKNAHELVVQHYSYESVKEAIKTAIESVNVSG